MAAVSVPFRLSVIASEGSEAEHALTLEALQITRLASIAPSRLVVDRCSTSTISWGGRPFCDEHFSGAQRFCPPWDASVSAARSQAERSRKRQTIVTWR